MIRDSMAKLTVKGEFLPEGGIKFPDGTTQTTAPTQGGGTITEIEDDDNGGIGVTNGTGPTVSLSIDASNLTALGTTVDQSDFVIIYDTDAASSKKALVSNLPFTNNQGTITGVTGGDGISSTGGSPTPTITVDCSATTSGLGFDGNDQLAIAYGNSGGVEVTNSNLLQLKLDTGSGLSLGTGGVSVDIGDSTDGTGGGAIGTNDFILFETGTTTKFGTVSQLPFTNNTGTVTPSSTDTFTNKSGDISMWTNDSGYTTNTGTVTPSSTDTFTNKSGDISQWTNDSGFTNNTGTVTQVSVQTGLDVTNGTTTPQISLDLSEFTEIPNSTTLGDTDQVIVLDGGAERKIDFQFIKLGLFDNDQGFIDAAGAPVQSVNGDTGTVSLAYDDLTTGAPTATNTTKGIVEYATNTEAGNASSTTTVLRPSNIGSIKYTDLTDILTGGNGIDITNGSITPNLDGGTLQVVAGGLSVVSTPGSLSGGTGLTITGGFDGSTNTTANVDFGGATPGSYTNANITIGNDGEVTTVSNGTAGGVEFTMIEAYPVGDVTVGPTFASSPLILTFTAANQNNKAQFRNNLNQCSWALNALGSGPITSIPAGLYVINITLQGKCDTGNQNQGIFVLAVEIDDGSGFIEKNKSSQFNFVNGMIGTLQLSAVCEFQNDNGQLRLKVINAGPAQNTSDLEVPSNMFSIVMDIQKA